jgi:hypothetical protein
MSGLIVSGQAAYLRNGLLFFFFFFFLACGGPENLTYLITLASHFM